MSDPLLPSEERGPRASPLPHGGSFAVWLGRAQATLDRCGYRPPAIRDRLLAAEMFAEQGRMELALGQLEEALVLLRAFLDAEGQAASLPDPQELRVERFLLQSLRQHRWLDAVAARVAQVLPGAPDAEQQLRALLREELAAFRAELSGQARAEVRRWGVVLRQTLRRTAQGERAELERLARSSAERAARSLREELKEEVRQELEKVALELRDDQRVLRIVKRYVLTRDAIKQSQAAGPGENVEESSDELRVENGASPALEPLAERLTRLEHLVRELSSRQSSGRDRTSGGSRSARKPATTPLPGKRSVDLGARDRRGKPHGSGPASS